MFSNQLRNDSTDDAATSMLSFLNMASATIKVTLGKPRGCRRKVNLRRHLQKHFLRLSGRKVASHLTAHERRRKSVSSLANAKRNPKTRLSCSNQTRQRQDAKPLDREPSPPSPHTLGVPSPTSSCALSLPATEKEIFPEKSTGCLQHLPLVWSDEDIRSPTCSSTSDGCDYPFSPSPACTPLRDDLSMSGDSVFSLPSSPMGVNQTARLFSNRHSEGGTEYPPRLHHLDLSDIMALSNQSHCACPAPYNPVPGKQTLSHQPAVNSFADFTMAATPSTPTCAAPWQPQTSTVGHRDLPMHHTYSPGFQSAHQTPAMMDPRQYYGASSYDMKAAGWQTAATSYTHSCGPTSAYSVPPPRSAKETFWSF